MLCHPKYVGGNDLYAALRGVFAPDAYQQCTIERSLREEQLLVVGPPGGYKASSLTQDLGRQAKPRFQG
jgi:hypothetical protein